MDRRGFVVKCHCILFATTKRPPPEHPISVSIVISVETNAPDNHVVSHYPKYRLVELTRTSKHILNVQAAIRAPCCQKWFDCAECHAEVSDHLIRKTNEMVFMCKKCRKAFRKDMMHYEESDEYCPHCDNHYVRMQFDSTDDWYSMFPPPLKGH